MPNLTQSSKIRIAIPKYVEKKTEFCKGELTLDKLGNLHPEPNISSEL